MRSRGAESIIPPVALLADRYRTVREFSERLTEPLEIEDYVIQSMPDVSPTRWHLAHTTWFFETFLLSRFANGYQPVNPNYKYLFNSYYNSVGPQFSRANRGVLSRPTVTEIFEYRREVDTRIHEFLSNVDLADEAEIVRVLEIGLHHEQQHQELLLTDIKHVLSCNPLYPTYAPSESISRAHQTPQISWCEFKGGLVEIGLDASDGDSTFSFDNERPRHQVFVGDFRFADRLVTNGEFLQFIRDDGYRRAELWLSLGWQTVQSEGWEAPLYWLEEDSSYSEFTLRGLKTLDPALPVTHLSYFEADAYARWVGARLPTEAEWERAAGTVSVEGSFVESERFHPAPVNAREIDFRTERLSQMFGDAWQWTASPYTPYPGYVAPDGALGEYNGKFMCNQYVLRGGSCATSRSHIRPTYRNFFPPDARWQFTGLRLAR